MKNHGCLLLYRRQRRNQWELSLEDLSMADQRSDDLSTNLENRIEIAQILGRLSPSTGELIELITELPIVQVCKRTGTSRSSFTESFAESDLHTIRSTRQTSAI